MSKSSDGAGQAPRPAHGAITVDLVSQRRLEAEKGLVPPALRLAPAAVSDWFAHRVARQPRDLRRHVQRLHHHIKNRDALACCAALADLFLVLGAHGEPLRRHMLEHARGLLPAAAEAWFRAHLEDGLPPHAPLPLPCPSVLWSGATGRTDLVASAAPVPARTPGASAEDTLEEANQLIFAGRLAEAHALLAAATAQAPADTELRQLLDKLSAHIREADSAPGAAAPRPEHRPPEPSRP